MIVTMKAAYPDGQHMKATLYCDRLGFLQMFAMVLARLRAVVCRSLASHGTMLSTVQCNPIHQSENVDISATVYIKG